MGAARKIKNLSAFFLFLTKLDKVISLYPNESDAAASESYVGPATRLGKIRAGGSADFDRNLNCSPCSAVMDINLRRTRRGNYILWR